MYLVDPVIKMRTIHTSCENDFKKKLLAVRHTGYSTQRENRLLCKNHFHQFPFFAFVLNLNLRLSSSLLQDHVYLQAVINKELQQAQVLSTRLRGAEYTRQQQDQVVQQLKQNLAKVKRIHDDQVTQDMTERRNREEQLNQQLVRERAELNRVRFCAISLALGWGKG